MKARKLISAILAGVMALSSLTTAASAERNLKTVETTASPRASSNVHQRYYFSDDVNYLYVEMMVQIWVDTNYPIYTDFLSYGYGDTGVYPQYRPTSCEYTISDDKKSVTCLFHLKKYLSDDTTDSKRYRKTVTFYADGEYTGP